MKEYRIKLYNPTLTYPYCEQIYYLLSECYLEAFRWAQMRARTSYKEYYNPNTLIYIEELTHGGRI